MTVVERAVFDHKVARHRPLLAEGVPDPRGCKTVGADRYLPRRRDDERLREPLEIVEDADAESIAALELDGKLAIRGPRLQRPGAVLDVGAGPDGGELADGCDPFRPRVEAETADVLAEVAATDEPYLGIEAVADDDPIELHAVAIGSVLHLVL